ncbi:serine/threonine protein kinase [Microbispora cellulosiformans]|uniref:non-specific serine/threonine protein kinase n=1 Tax=Microbispora cellulosiformans TaxID=2614688 RepID=A0A5J5K9P6_9ACTN|nr:serine/threonine-protein kinase [Microbispora cellulosiformans]KAA9380123.1 serine/threonine protein kinase [Microbispora cellulosiformans]
MVIADRYELDHPIGKGGMGEVYAGHDRQLDRKIAIKFIGLAPGIPLDELERRFLREARIMARLDHPGAPAIYDAGAYDDPVTGHRRLFQVMQFVRGSSVSDLIAEIGPLPIGWAACIAAQVCAVLDAAHELSILHRDLKPGNLMICKDGSVKVLDFGLAVLDDPQFSRYTRTGQIVGTPPYMSPEQVQSWPLSPRSDLYALGCVLYEMLTGARVFPGPSEYQTLHQQVNDEPRPVALLRRDVPSPLNDLVLALLAKMPEDRPPDAGTVFAELSHFAAGAVPLPGFVGAHPTNSPLQRYARALATVSANEPSTGPEEPFDAIRPISVSELKAIRNQATSLAVESRYTRAVEILTEAVGPAERLLGAESADVLSLRLELADLLFEGGDYRRAACEYRHLGEIYRRLEGTGGAPLYHCRLREANCRAMGGETGVALKQLTALFEEQRGLHRDTDSQQVELRKQIGLLQLSAGDSEAAEQTLTALRSDIASVHGSHNPKLSEVSRVIDQIRSKES